ncbi:hypothetical protein Tco_0731753 [Tanacetum coccineum]
MAILEEDVHEIHGELTKQSEVIDVMGHDFSRFCTWTTTSLARMMERAGVTYTSYFEAPREYQRHGVRQRTDEAKSSLAAKEDLFHWDFTIGIKACGETLNKKNFIRSRSLPIISTMLAAIKSRFGGNVESKKMPKTVLKKQFENFFVSNIEGLDKVYDRFQKLISLLEVHGAAVPNKDANQKFLRALPSSWNNVTLIMRNKDGINDLDIDDLYNNLKVFEVDIKGSSGSSSNSQNVAILSTEDTSSSNEVNTANGVITASGHNSQGQASSSSYTNDLMFSFSANQSNSPKLDDEDLEQIDHDDLEEMDLK